MAAVRPTTRRPPNRRCCTSAPAQTLNAHRTRDGRCCRRWSRARPAHRARDDARRPCAAPPRCRSMGIQLGGSRQQSFERALLLLARGAAAPAARARSVRCSGWHTTCAASRTQAAGDRASGRGAVAAPAATARRSSAPASCTDCSNTTADARPSARGWLEKGVARRRGVGRERGARAVRGGRLASFCWGCSRSSSDDLGLRRTRRASACTRLRARAEALREPGPRQAAYWLEAMFARAPWAIRKRVADAAERLARTAGRNTTRPEGKAAALWFRGWAEAHLGDPRRRPSPHSRGL